MKKFKIPNKLIQIIGLAILLIIISTIVIFIFFKDGNNLVDEIYINKIQYDATSEIDEANNKLQTDKKKAGIISGTGTNENVVALTFDGLTDESTMEKIVNMLSEYNMKGTFFVPGIKAAEDGAAVKTIANANQKIGNYTLSEAKDIGSYTQFEQIEDFCRTNVILGKISGQEPSLLKCNVTEYSDQILEASYASNLPQVVLSNQYISFQSFSSYEMTANYIKNLKKGSIVSIKLEGVLDDSEYNKSQQIKDDKQQTELVSKENKTNQLTQEQQLIIVIEWILKALNENNIKSVYVDDQILVSRSNSDAGNQIVTPRENYLHSAADKTITTNPIQNTSQPAIEQAINYPDLKAMIKANNGEESTVVNHLYTSQKGVVFTFRGISNEAVLDNVLIQLKNLGNVKATFFVTANEIEKYPERIKKIVDAGHEIGNGGVTQDSKIQGLSTEEICKEIYRCDTLLQTLGIDTNDYMAGYGYTQGNIKEAVSALSSGYKEYNLITYTFSMVRNSFTDLSADEIIEECLPVHIYKSLKRGDIAYFRLDSNVFNDNNQMIPELINQVANKYVFNGYVSVCIESSEEESIYETKQIPLNYQILSLSEMMDTYEDLGSGILGRYSLSVENAEVEPGKIDNEIANNMIYTNYIGNPSVKGSQLKGFTDTTGIDFSGKIDTDGKKIIFLTFDDWGGDPVVMSILDVLKKHQVEASFFVIAKNVDVNQEELPEDERITPNPNLLREMALNGHDICSHNYFHMLIDINDNIVDKEILQNEVVHGNEALSMVVGDISEPQLYFRPPTLSVSKTGLETVFECGYTNIVSGDFSVHDYDCVSPEEVNNTMKYGNGTYEIGNGSIVILHINDQSGFTAEGLDLFLTENENKPDDEKYQFAKLSDYLN